MSAQDSINSSPAIAEMPAQPCRNCGVHRCDWFIAELGTPEPLRTVIAWRSASELPCAAYFDAEENCWTSAHDGARLDDVTDWMYYQTPQGEESGLGGPMSVTARAARIKRLAERANTITAMLSTIHFLEAAAQESALLDCSSMADDFSRDLNTLVGEPA